MLSLEVHRALAETIRHVHEVAAVAEQRVAYDELNLRVDRALASVRELEAVTALEFGQLHRHLGWLRRRHGEGRPELADGDIRDLREHDLPAAIDAVASWTAGLLDDRLVAAAEGSWAGQQYDAAVRDAFVCLEERLRALGGVTRQEGVVGRRLVSRVLPGAGRTERWTTNGMLGELSDQEQAAARELLNGTLGLFRNATAHRVTAYTRAEAEDVMHLVNLCLRLLAKVNTQAP